MGIDQLIERIRSYAALRGWKKSTLAKKANMRDTTLRGFDEPDWNPTVETIRRLEAIIPTDFGAPAEQSEAA